jgi:hypothetical protein
VRQFGAAQRTADDKAHQGYDARVQALGLEAQARAQEMRAVDQLTLEAKQKDSVWVKEMWTGDHHAHNPAGDKQPTPPPKPQKPLNYIEKFMIRYQVVGHVTEDDFLDELTERILDLIEEEWTTERERGVEVTPY